MEPVIMMARDMSDYFKYEGYYLLNFCLLPCDFQMRNFYIKNIDPVDRKNHYHAVNLDSDYNQDIINPLYQLFFSGFFYSGNFMYLIEELYGMGDAYDELNIVRESLFSDDFLGDFFDGIYENTSVDGFIFGKFWEEIRRRSKTLLIECNLVDQLTYHKPMKFSGFLYPDDFTIYKKIPYWSKFGEIIPFDEWEILKKRTLNLYSDAILNF